MMNKKILSYTILLLIFLTSCGLVKFQDDSTITLPETMLTLEGEEVNEITLKRGDAAILTYKDKQNASFEVQSEIRKHQSIRLGGYFYRGFKDSGHISTDQLDWVSTSLDLLSINEYGSPGTVGYVITPEEIQNLKDRNKKLQVYMMVYATTMIEPLFNPEAMSDWTLKNKVGDEVVGLRRKSETSNRHVMDMQNPEYRDFFANFITEHVQQYNADGVAIDEIMWEGYWDIDTEDIAGYDSKEDYYQASLGFLETLDSVSTTNIIHQAFWDDGQRFSDGIWGESAFKFHYGEEKQKVFYKSMTYTEIINNMINISSQNNDYIWAAWYKEGSIKDIKYLMATYLMGKGSNSIVMQLQPFGADLTKKRSYDLEEFRNEYMKHKEYLDIDLGNPTGLPQKYQDRSVWIREYEKGLVICYPRK